MVRTILAARLVNRAADWLEYDNQPEDALALTSRALARLAHETSPLARAHVGRAHQVRAECYLKLDRLDDAISSYAEAERHLRGRYIELYVRCCHDAAVTFANMGLEDLARDYATAGREVAARVPGPYREDFERLLLELEPCTAETYRDYVARMRDEAAQTSDSESARRALLRLAHATCEFGSAAEVNAIFDVIAALVRNSRTVEQRLSALAPIVFLARRLQPVPEELLAACEQAAKQLAPNADTAVQAEAQLTLAVALWSHGRREEALEPALRAVALHNVEAWRTAASVVRLLIGAHRSTAQDVALRLACELRDGPLAAELIETARLPALPDTTAPSQTVSVPTPTGEIIVAQRALGPLHAITVAGQARLASYYPAGVQTGAPVDLDALTASIGGANAWWWGSWLGAYGVLFWALRTPDRVYTCGVQDDSAAAASLAAAHEAMPGADGATHGAFTATAGREQAFSAELGALLIPAELRARLFDAARNQQRPLSLVVASNFLSEIPILLLGVGDSDAGVSLRLVEGATLRLAPPAALIAELADRQASPPPYRVSVLCLDPGDDLTHAQLSAECEHLLGGPKLCGRHSDATLATQPALINALRSVDPARAIFAYSGHAARGDLGPDLNSNLPLVDGALTAQSIFAGHTDGDRIPIPERVLLAACASAGSGGAGGGEWLGLTAAALSSGAREILATCWPIWDLPVTRELDNELLQVLITAEDIAGALREIQLRLLERWRSCEADHTTEPVKRSAIEPFPLVWAAYQYIGRPNHAATPPA